MVLVGKRKEGERGKGKGEGKSEGKVREGGRGGKRMSRRTRRGRGRRKGMANERKERERESEEGRGSETAGECQEEEAGSASRRNEERHGRCQGAPAFRNGAPCGDGGTAVTATRALPSRRGRHDACAGNAAATKTRNQTTPWITIAPKYIKMITPTSGKYKERP